MKEPPGKCARRAAVAISTLAILLVCGVNAFVAYKRFSSTNNLPRVLFSTRHVPGLHREPSRELESLRILGPNSQPAANAAISIFYVHQRDPKVELQTLETVAAIHSPNFVDFLKSVLVSDFSDIDEKRAALRSLQLCDPFAERSQDVLTKILRNYITLPHTGAQAYSPLAQEAVIAISKMRRHNRPVISDLLITMICSDLADRSFLHDMLLALDRVGLSREKVGSRALLKILQSNKDEDIEVAALIVVGDSVAEIPENLRPAFVRTITTFLSRANVPVVGSAIDTLGKFGKEAVHSIPALQKIRASSDNPLLKMEADYVLKQILEKCE